MSTWYRTGTVSVTNGSKNVVGTGTAWSVMISVGDVFTLDNSVLYEIQTITDDLHIVLDRNYEGATETDQTYTIIPWSVKRSLNAEILDRINKLLEWAHDIFVTQWTTDTNGDYEVSTTLDKNIVPKVNNGASLGTTLKKWAKAYLTALSINGVDILPTTTPTASSVPISDETGKIDSGWVSDASTTVKGVAELATPDEVATGLDTSRVSTPAGLVGIRSNQNILHNWDFRNPVNQRGLTTLSVDTGYFIDRWKINASGTDCVASLISGGVSLTRPAPNYIGLRQYIENPARYSGLTVTLSATIKGSGSFRIYADGVSYGLIAITNEAEYTLKQATFTLPTIASELYVHFSSGNGGTLYIQRVKFELGKVSTLENDPPMDYGQELLTCQRYYYQSVSGGAPFIYRTRNFSNGTYSIPYFIQYHFPVQMRIAPTVEVTYDINDAAPVTAAGYAVTTVSGSISAELTTMQYLDINKIVASADL